MSVCVRDYVNIFQVFVMKLCRAIVMGKNRFNFAVVTQCDYRLIAGMMHTSNAEDTIKY